MRRLIRQLDEAIKRPGPVRPGPGMRKNMRDLTLTADQWSLYTDSITDAVTALNQAIREAATLVQGEIDAGLVKTKAALEDAITRAIYDKWEDVAQQHRRVGAGDTAVRDVAFEALRKHFGYGKGMK